MQSTKQNSMFKRELYWSSTILAFWFAVTVIFSVSNIWDKLPFWLFPSTIALGIMIPFWAYLKIPSFQGLVDSFSIRSLTLFHIWRIVAGLYFLKLGANGYLPLTFAHNAGYGDTVVGLAALLFIFWDPSRFGYLVFHLLSMADFVLAVGTGLVFTILQVPLMGHIQTFPVALIPGFGVGVTGALSLATLYRLLNRNISSDLKIRTKQ